MSAPDEPARWFYARAGERFGPVPAEAVREMAAAGDLGPDDLVWKEGTDDWRPARQVRGLFPAARDRALPVPPPLPFAPPPPPASRTGPAPAGTPAGRPPLRAVGLAQRRLLRAAPVVAVVPLLLLSPLFGAAPADPRAEAMLPGYVTHDITFGSAEWVFGLGLMALPIFCLVRLAAAMRWSAAATVAAAAITLVPVVGLVALLFINRQATHALRRAGIPVGGDGVRTADLPPVRAE